MSITAVVVRPGEAPAVEQVEADLRHLQEIVGGFIEAVPIGPGIHAYANEDGVAEGLPANRCGILGTFVILGEDDDGGERSLTCDEVRSVLAYCETYEGELHPTLVGEEPEVGMLSFADFEAMKRYLDASYNRMLMKWIAGVRGGRRQGGRA